MFWLRPGLLILVLILLVPFDSTAQMERKRANPGAPIDDIFWAPTIIATSSVTNIPSGNLNVTIHHVFGRVSSGVEALWGLDDAANIRFGFDYGVTDWLSLGVGRSRFDKVYDFRFKASVLRQSRDGKMPVSLSIGADAGINTVENGFDLIDRLNYFSTVMVARKFSKRISLQAAPMYAHFNTVVIEYDAEGNRINQENGHLAIGLVAGYVLSQRYALLVEYIPVIGDRSDGTKNSFSVGLDIDTGGHVFQVFFTTSQWMTGQHTIARNTDDFFSGDFRLGFNVNRAFGVN